MAKRQGVAIRRKVNAGQSETELSALVTKKLGVEIEATRLRKFVCDHFHLLSVLCHEIHAAEN